MNDIEKQQLKNRRAALKAASRKFKTLHTPYDVIHDAQKFLEWLEKKS